MRYCGNIEDAEDVLHDGFIKIIRYQDTFRSNHEKSLEGWMKRIIVNTALNYIRDHRKEKYFLDIDKMPMSISPKEEEEEETLIQELRKKISTEQVMRLLVELPVGYRTIFNLFVFEEYSHREIANILGCTENTSKSQLSKARGMLRKKILETVKANVSDHLCGV